MTKHDAPQSRPSRLLIAGAWIGSIAALGGIVAMVLIAIDKVRTGHGLDTYRTHWLVEFNWIGLLAFLGILVVALAIGLFLRLRERREERELLDKYSDGRHG